MDLLLLIYIPFSAIVNIWKIKKITQGFFNLISLCNKKTLCVSVLFCTLITDLMEFQFIFDTFCSHQQHHGREGLQKQVNTEEGKQINLILCTSSGHIGLFPQCQSQQSKTSANYPDVAASFHLNTLCVFAQYAPSGERQTRHKAKKIIRSWKWYISTLWLTLGRQKHKKSLMFDQKTWRLVCLS